VKVIELMDAKAALADYARDVETFPVIVTVDGKPIAALIAVRNADLETVKLSTNREFLEIVEEARARYDAEGGISGPEMRRRLAES